MILFTFLVVQCVSGVHSQPATCNDDVHCSVGYFCHTATHCCQECFSCEQLSRHPAAKDGCVKSGAQCGPCYQGLIVSEADWTARCQPPEKNSTKILSSYIYILVTCVATGLLLSLFIIHVIWNTHIIKVNIAVPSRQKTST